MVLISHLGLQDSNIFPILYEFKDELVTHILIHDISKYDKEKSLKITNSINEFKLNYQVEFSTEVLNFDEDSDTSILGLVKKLEKYSGNDFSNLYFNGTGALATTSVLISNELLKRNGSLIAYDIFDNGYNLLKNKNLQKKKIENNIDIYTHLLLKGYKLLSFGNKLQAYKRKNEILNICKNMNRFRDFLQLLNNTSFNDMQDFNDIKDFIIKIDKQNDLSFIRGTVFEEYIFWLIVDNLDFDDVMFNVKVEFSDDFINEFDILMIKNNHLHTIECKLRNFIDGSHFIYKIDSTVDFLDDDGKAMLLVLGEENEKIKNGKVKKQFTNGTKSRAKNTNIKIHHTIDFDRDKFIDDVKKHFLV